MSEIPFLQVGRGSTGNPIIAGGQLDLAQSLPNDQCEKIDTLNFAYEVKRGLRYSEYKSSGSSEFESKEKGEGTLQ